MNKRQWKKLYKLTSGWTTFAGQDEYLILHALHRAGSIYRYLYLKAHGREKEWVPKFKCIKVKCPAPLE